jgi:hypothetical protein
MECCEAIVEVVPYSKRTRLLPAEPREPSPEVDAFFARNVRSGAPLPPKR